MNSNEIAEDNISGYLEEISETIRNVSLNTPPDLAADIIEKGIVISGGGGLLKNIDEYISKVTGVNAYVAEDPLLLCG